MPRHGRVLHFADLHLSWEGENREYGLSVLQEILHIAAEEEVELLIAGGDLFDTRKDFEALLAEVDSRVASTVPEARFIVLPGNHEELVRGDEPLRALSSTERIEIARAIPFGHYRFSSFDLVTVPFQSDYAGFEEWSIPAKELRHRIVAAHGSLLGASISAGLLEERDSVLDPVLFERFNADYAALGHIHQAQEVTLGTTRYVYPGSARVWRSGEKGARGLRILQVDSEITSQRRELASAGRHRSLRLFLDEDSLERFGKQCSTWEPADWVHLDFFGIAESDVASTAIADAFCDSAGRFVRKVTRDLSDVLVVSGASSSSLVSRFLDEWQSRYSEGPEDDDAWKEARTIGLDRIAKALR